MNSRKSTTISLALRQVRIASAISFLAILSAAPDSHAVDCYGVQRPVCAFANDPGSFFYVTGYNLLGTTFETWPDGSPTYPGQQLTSAMNYTQIGVTFSAPIGDPFIRDVASFKALEADSGGFERDWIGADFASAASAVAIEFPAETTLYAYDGANNLLASVSFFLPGADGLFLGIASDIPIARAVVDRGGSTELIDTFYFKPIPEPAVGLLLGLGLAVLRHRRFKRAAAYRRPLGRPSTTGLSSRPGDQRRNTAVSNRRRGC